MTDDVPNLLEGSIRIYITVRLGRNPSKEEVTELAKEWEKAPRMPLKEFMMRKGF